MHIYLVKDDEGAYLCQEDGKWYFATIIAWAHPFSTEFTALKYAQKYNAAVVRATITIKED